MSSRVEAMCQVMEHLVTHDGPGGHGYSQPGRYGTGGTETVTTCIGDVAIATGDRDCTSSVETAMKAVGLPTGGFYYTGNASLLGGAGWMWHPISDGPRRGDVLYYHRYGSIGHMALHLGAGKLAEFYLSENGTIDGQPGDQTGWESRITDYYNPGWDGMFRWENDDETEDDMTPEESKMLREVHKQLTRTDTAGHDNPQGHDIFGRVQIIESQLDDVHDRVTRTDTQGHGTPKGHDLFGRVNMLQEDMAVVKGALAEIAEALKA